MTTITTQQLLASIQAKLPEKEISNSFLQHILNMTFDTITEIVANGDKVRVHKFGSFFMTDIDGKMCNDIRSTDPTKKIYVPAHNKFKFSPAINTKEAINPKETTEE